MFIVLCETTYELLCFPNPNQSHLQPYLQTAVAGRIAKLGIRRGYHAVRTGKSLEWRQSVEVMPSKLEDDVLEDMPPKSIHVSRDILTVVKTKTALLGSPCQV